jgi:hypothetical protein
VENIGYFSCSGAISVPAISAILQTPRDASGEPDVVAILLVLGILIALGYWFLRRGSS